MDTNIDLYGYFFFKVLFTFSGPVIGSALYKAGGFGMPFWVVGATGCVVAVCLHFMIPNVKGKNADSSDATKKSLTIKNVFKVSIYTTICQDICCNNNQLQSPTIFIPLVDTLIVFTGYGFINGMLAPYMKDHAGASQNQVGIAFFLMGTTYTISSVASGLVSNDEVEDILKILIIPLVLLFRYSTNSNIQ